ncbi:heparinase II/III family protein [Ochrobactrum sp. A-1]|uniref:heparinase II/III family protein n=1 Tax=Ochrobactrum sp. A-1 TaxID=2920940 RepID=UPI001F0AC25C|nr:heparinase II/III family protein [Ochrobactrum sp. A-1]
MTSKPVLLWETVRHLRPVQFYGRLWFRLMRPKPDLRPAPPLRETSQRWVQPACRVQRQTGPTEFRFLNEIHDLSKLGWDDPAVAKLWRYNLHYFDDLNAEGAEDRTAWHEALIIRWIAENSPGSGSAWEPYPTSLRIVNWIKWARRGNQLPAGVVASLAVQARWLTRRLEYHLLGNHLFANAKALVFAGCFFRGDEAASWLQRGLRILSREVPEQILGDGAQFELSPMYHALALEDMLDLVNMMRSSDEPVPEAWEKKIVEMRAWLAAMSHPDGGIAFFNDAAFGIAPSGDELERYASNLGFAPTKGMADECTHLQDSGYIRLQNQRAVTLLDVAHVGPDYLPGHAHADTLSFELSVDGNRVIVNSGTSLYGNGPERARQRGTAAHNTITIDQKDSSEIWSGFRVARRARPQGLEMRKSGNEWVVSCSHDGYRWLAGKPVHHRTWEFGPNKLLVMDMVTGRFQHAEAVFHFHPDLTVTLFEDGRSGMVGKGATTLLRWTVYRGLATLQPSTWHPEFGVSLPSQRLVIQLVDGECAMQMTW